MNSITAKSESLRQYDVCDFITVHLPKRLERADCAAGGRAPGKRVLPSEPGTVVLGEAS